MARAASELKASIQRDRHILAKFPRRYVHLFMIKLNRWLSKAFLDRILFTEFLQNFDDDRVQILLFV